MTTKINPQLLEQHVEAIIGWIFARHQIVARCHNGVIWVMRGEQAEPLCLWTGKTIPRAEVIRRRPSPLAQLNYLFMTPADRGKMFSQIHILFADGSFVLKHFSGIVRIKHLIGHLAIGFDHSGTAFLLNARTGEMLRKENARTKCLSSK